MISPAANSMKHIRRSSLLQGNKMIMQVRSSGSDIQAAVLVTQAPTWGPRMRQVKAQAPGLPHTGASGLPASRLRVGPGLSTVTV